MMLVVAMAMVGRKMVTTKLVDMRAIGLEAEPEPPSGKMIRKPNKSATPTFCPISLIL